MRTIVISMAALLTAAQLGAQATRTWVSGVGDDANPCSRTAPCKTFAGAISKTAAGGEIDVLDPGGFGAVTITKSIKIDGGGGAGGVLASNTNGIVISAGASDIIVLRNLSINGAGTTAGQDTRGIKFLSGKTLIVDHCEVLNFAKRNISIESSTAGAQAFITNTRIDDSQTNGVIVSPPSGIQNQAVFDHVQIVSNAFYGLGATPGSSVQINDSVISNNGGGATPGGGILTSGGTISLQSTLISGNPIGIEVQGGGAIRISNVTVVSNGTGTDIQSGTVTSYGNNQLAGNVAGNSPALTTASRQ